MLHFINICLLLLLAVVLFQDLKERQISWLLIPLLLGFFGIQGLYQLSVNEFVHFTFLNIGFVVIQLFILTIYMSIKNRRFVNIINSYLGLGDVSFFVAIAAAFSPINFIAFYIIGLLFTLLFFVALKKVIKTNLTEIPLAGALSAMMMVLILVNQWTPGFNFYNDDFFNSMIYSLVK